MAEDPQYNKRLLRSFLRLRVLLDLRKPLVEGFWIPKPDKSIVWASVKYEKLQDFCYRCGNVAHSFRGCNKQRLMSCANPDKPRYGNWTATEQVRTWEDAVVRIKEEWSEVNMKWRKQKEEWRNKDSAKTLNVEDVFVIGINHASSSVKPVFAKEQVLQEKEERHVECTEGLIGSKDGLSGSNGMKKSEDRAETDVSSHSYMKGSEECREEPLKEREDEKAIVVYVEKEVLEIANAIGDLNLKRGAVEDLESDVKKKRRTCESEKPELISTFVRYLRRTKTKARRSMSLKGKGVEGDMTGGKEKGKEAQKKVGITEETEGMGGWPQTAPMEP